MQASPAALDLRADGSRTSLVQRIERFAAETPEKVAMVTDTVRISYEELNRLANQRAHFLRSQGLTKQTIGIIGDSKLDAIISQLAILKVNGTFVVLDAKDPPQRIAFIMENAALKAVLKSGNILPPIPSVGDSPIFDLEERNSEISTQSSDNLHLEPAEASPAYLLYTSGSTANMPKGVIQTQENIVYQIEHYTRDFKITADDRLFQLATLAHDQSIVDIYGAFLNGATLVVHQGPLDITKILSEITTQRVSIFSSIPSMFDIIFRQAKPEHDLSQLRIITIGGEETTLDHARCFRSLSLARDSQLINGYGATECSWVSFYAIDQTTDLEHHASFPLGKIAAGLDFHIQTVDSEGAPYEIPGSGELWISGEGVSPGYWRNPAATAESFVTAESKTWYKTGDIVSTHADGVLHFLGREKWHEKISGKRINLKEIEDGISRALSDLDVTNCIVVAAGEGINKKLLCCLTFSHEISEMERAAAFKIIRDLELPEHMKPANIQILDETTLPRLANGKINRHELKRISETATTPARELEQTPPSASRSEHPLQKVKDLWYRTLGHGVFDDADTACRDAVPFKDLGGESLQAAAFIADYITLCINTLNIIPPPLSICELKSSICLNDIISRLSEAYSIKSKEKKVTTLTQEEKIDILKAHKLICACFTLKDTDDFPISGVFVLKNYMSLSLSFMDMKILADFYNKKYEICITPCTSYEVVIECIKQALESKAEKIGLTIPAMNDKEAHPIPCILFKQDDNNYKFILSDSVGMYHAIPSFWQTFVNFKKTLEGKITLEIALDRQARLRDTQSCNIDAMCYLKNVLRLDVKTKFVTEFFYTMEDGEDGNEIYAVKENPIDTLKGSQDLNTEALKNKDALLFGNKKTITTHLNKHIKDVEAIDTMDKIEKSVTCNTYLYTKASKFIQILASAEPRP